MTSDGESVGCATVLGRDRQGGFALLGGVGASRADRFGALGTESQESAGISNRLVGLSIGEQLHACSEGFATNTCNRHGALTTQHDNRGRRVGARGRHVHRVTSFPNDEMGKQAGAKFSTLAIACDSNALFGNSSCEGG